MTETQKKSWLMRFLHRVEAIGNKMPNPAFIFMILCVVIVLASWLLSKLGVSVTNPADGSLVVVENLLTTEYLGRMVAEAGSNFASFPALSAVLVIMLGIGVAENSGYFEAVLTNIVEVAPQKYMLWILIFIGIISNVAGDAGPVVLPPLAGLIFLKLGLNPIAGVIIGYVAPLGAFAANVLLGMSDALVFAFTDASAKTIQADIQLNVAMNYFFIIVSAFVLLPVIYFILTKVSLKQLGSYDPQYASFDVHAGHSDMTSQQKQAVRKANWSFFITIAIIAIIALWPGSFLQNQETGSLLTGSPFMTGITVIMAIIFFVPGFVYGKATKVINNTHDLIHMMTKSMASMASFIVIVFFTSQMLAYFNWSKIGTIMAVSGAELLKHTNGIVLIIGFILLTSFINMFIGSASAKWAILAPIFVPMFMLLNLHPAFTQMVYRIGDGITNPLSPMQAYIPLVLSLLQKYDKRAGMGTLMSNVLPYSVAIGIAWTLLIIVWYLCNLPLGPASPIFLG